ncbi:hypothetical protein [Bacillus licheniformis]|uniref:hypothetical protein n=2 Tax=Bacillus licheniformis TaxID=1402 RepID=UPI0010729174|nr:hypothetical protein [Bacillus licheniformis]
MSTTSPAEFFTPRTLSLIPGAVKQAAAAGFRPLSPSNSPRISELLEAIRVKTSVKNDLPKAKNGCKLEEIRSFSSFLFFCIKKRLFSYEKRRQLVDKVTKKWLDRQAFFVKMCVESNFWRFYHVDQTL